MYHLSFNCFYVQAFWDRFATWWCDLSRESLNLGLKHAIVDSASRNDIKLLDNFWEIMYLGMQEK